MQPAAFNHDDLPAALSRHIQEQWQLFTAELDAADRSLADAHHRQIELLWVASEYALKLSQKHPHWLLSLLRQTLPVHSRDALAQRLQSAFESVNDESALQQIIRHFRHAESLRIIWRDVVMQAPLEETLAATSDLADLLVDVALNWHHRQLCEAHGVPRSEDGEAQQLVVLGMGKLGGRELNFSSDIDLIFAYAEKGETDGERSLANETFFTRLGQRLIKALDQTTADGFAYRVDMRLRPFGDSGALVTHFDAMEHYYETHGREWERYALVKARPIAGDTESGEELLQRLRGFIYRRYLDYAVIESLREMKAMIARQAEARGQEQNLKLGPGGIREVEFVVQMFQLVRGGRDRHLQLRSLLPALRYLAQQSLLPEKTAAMLEQNYKFLRQVENRIQMQHDAQQHSLPDDAQERQRLWLGLGYKDRVKFMADLEEHRRTVREQFAATFQSDESAPAEEKSLQSLWEQFWLILVARQEKTVLDEFLRQYSLTAPDSLTEHLQGFLEDRRVRMMSKHGRERLDKLMPLLLEEVHRRDGDSAETLKRLLDFLTAVVQRSAYIAFLAEKPQVLILLIKLCAASAWIAEYLTKYPLLLDELLDPETLFAPPDRARLTALLEDAMSRVDPDDQEGVINQLRHFKHAQVLRVAAADIMDVLPLMRVSDQLTWIAEAILGKVLALAWAELVARHGTPQAGEGEPAGAAAFVMIGYGKLGGIEMGYGSDLDLVFLHNAQADEMTPGEKSISNGQFFARLGQRIITLLTVFTTAGELYEVDMRLRPSGNSGLLVSSTEAFVRYQQDQAWLWEKQALVRARPVAGSESLGQWFEAMRKTILCEARQETEVARQVLEMRQKMWQSADASSDDFDLKKSPGGITDIEFMVQYLVLAHAHVHSSLVTYTDNIRILEQLAACGVIPAEAETRLADIYRLFRDDIHRLTLQGLPPRVADEKHAGARDYVRQCWRDWLELKANE